jgi:hypothetical protein
VIQVSYPYNAFVDESVQERYGVKATGVSAYLATFDNWMKFEQEWRGILKHFEIPLDGKEGHDQPFMHMTDFIARKRQFDNGWPNSRRDEFIERLTMTASEHTIVGVSVSVIDEEFERALPDDALGFWREPYFFCLWGVLSSIIGLEDRFEGIAVPSPVWLLFDPRPKARQFAAQIFHAVKRINKAPTVFGEMGFGEMWRAPQIQAADILVYESVRRRIERQNNPGVAMRKSLKTLTRKHKVLMVELSEPGFGAYVKFIRQSPAAQQEED